MAAPGAKRYSRTTPSGVIFMWYVGNTEGNDFTEKVVNRSNLSVSFVKIARREKSGVKYDKRIINGCFSSMVP